MMKKHMLLIFIIMANMFVSAADAAIIGSYTADFGKCNISAEVNWAASIWISDDPVFPKTTLFNGEDLVPLDHTGIDIFSNVGKTFWVASDADDPEFGSVVTQLTDCVADYLWIAIGTPGGGFGLPVPINCLLGQPNNFSINNFKGYTIGRIGLNITSAMHTVDYSKTYPHTYSMSIACLIDDTVPEPASLLVIISGIAGLCITKLRICWCKIGDIK